MIGIYKTFADIPESEWKKLAEQVKKANGKLIIFVHPLFFSIITDHYKKTRDALLKQEVTPKLVLEGTGNLDSTKEHLEKIGVEALMVPTSDTSPEVFIGQKTIGYVKHDIHDEEFEIIIKKLKEIGVKEIRLGGIKAEKGRPKKIWEEEKDKSQKDKAEKNKKPEKDKAEEIREYEIKTHAKNRVIPEQVISKGCVGGAYYLFIKAGFNVKLIPEMCYPDKPPYYLNRHQKRPKSMISRLKKRIGKK